MPTWAKIVAVKKMGSFENCNSNNSELTTLIHVQTWVTGFQTCISTTWSLSIADSSKEPSTKDSSMDTNHNSKSADQHHKAATNTSSTGSNSSSEDEHSVTTAVDANMVSEDEDKEADESMKEDH